MYFFSYVDFPSDFQFLFSCVFLGEDGGSCSCPSSVPTTLRDDVVLQMDKQSTNIPISMICFFFQLSAGDDCPKAHYPVPPEINVFFVL